MKLIIEEGRREVSSMAVEDSEILIDFLFYLYILNGNPILVFYSGALMSGKDIIVFLGEVLVGGGCQWQIWILEAEEG